MGITRHLFGQRLFEIDVFITQSLDLTAAEPKHSLYFHALCQKYPDDMRSQRALYYTMLRPIYEQLY